MSIYLDLELRVKSGDLAGIIARWEFGGEILKERDANGGKQLPNGRLVEICEEVGRGHTEINCRMKFASLLDTKEEVADKSATYDHSWYRITHEFLPDNPDINTYADKLALELNKFLDERVERIEELVTYQGKLRPMVRSNFAGSLEHISHRYLNYSKKFNRGIT